MSFPFLLHALQKNRLGFRPAYWKWISISRFVRMRWNDETPVYGRLKVTIELGGESVPSFEITQAVYQNIKIDRVRGVEVILVAECFARWFFVQGFVERILRRSQHWGLPYARQSRTIERMTTQGRLNLETIAWDNVDLPDPEDPAIPMMLTSAHGGE